MILTLRNFFTNIFSPSVFFLNFQACQYFKDHFKVISNLEKFLRIVSNFGKLKKSCSFKKFLKIISDTVKLLRKNYFLDNSLINLVKFFREIFWLGNFFTKSLIFGTKSFLWKINFWNLSWNILCSKTFYLMGFYVLNFFLTINEILRSCLKQPKLSVLNFKLFSTTIFTVITFKKKKKKKKISQKNGILIIRKKHLHNSLLKLKPTTFARVILAIKHK